MKRNLSLAFGSGIEQTRRTHPKEPTTNEEHTGYFHQPEKLNSKEIAPCEKQIGSPSDQRCPNNATTNNVNYPTRGNLELPLELWKHIFSFLDNIFQIPKYLVNMRLICKYMNHIVNKCFGTNVTLEINNNGTALNFHNLLIDFINENCNKEPNNNSYLATLVEEPLNLSLNINILDPNFKYEESLFGHKGAVENGKYQKHLKNPQKE
ncbi:MAG: F-box protein [Neisseriaceae bacterium]